MLTVPPSKACLPCATPDDDDVVLNVLGCRVGKLGTNCNKLLKLKIEGGGGGGRFSFSTCNHVRRAARRLFLVKKRNCVVGCAFYCRKRYTRRHGPIIYTGPGPYRHLASAYCEDLLEKYPEKPCGMSSESKAGGRGVELVFPTMVLKLRNSSLHYVLACTLDE